MVRGPFHPRRDGSLEVRLSEVEAQALRRVAADMGRALEVSEEPSLQRLFPPAYPDDDERQREFERLTRDDLVERKRAASRSVLASLDAGSSRRGQWKGVLDAEESAAWLALLNDARLVLGTRLDVSEEMDPESFPPDDPRAPMMNLYYYLSGLEEGLIDALHAGEFGNG